MLETESIIGIFQDGHSRCHPMEIYPEFRKFILNFGLLLVDGPQPTVNKVIAVSMTIGYWYWAYFGHDWRYCIHTSKEQNFPERVLHTYD